MRNSREVWKITRNPHKCKTSSHRRKGIIFREDLIETQRLC